MNFLDGMGSGLPRAHWSKEASSLRFAFKYWSTPGINHFCYWIIGATVEAIIRRWGCHVGGNNLTRFW